MSVAIYFNLDQSKILLSGNGLKYGITGIFPQKIISFYYVSGHGIVITKPIEMITYYIKHRNEREKQIVTALKDNTKNPLTTLQIVNIVYKVNPRINSCPDDKKLTLSKLKAFADDKINIT